MADNDQGGSAQEPRQPATQEMLDAAGRYANEIRERSPQLADTTTILRNEHSEPLRANQSEFQHSVARTTEDVEKALGHQLPLSDAARSDMVRLAGSAPGLENERMIALLQSTPSISNPELVRDLRTTAQEIGRQTDQNTDHIRDRLDHLEHAVRQADRAPPLAPPPEAPKGEATIAPNNARTDRPDGADASPESQAGTRQGRPSQKGQEETARTQEEARAQAAAQQANVHVRQPTVLDHINGVVRHVTGGGASAPWDSAPQPFAGRLAAFESRVNEGRDNNGLQNAERAGRAALDAMEGFRTGDGATIMNRIASAARSDPEGMSGVMAGMRDGGRYQDLRQQFNTALVEEKGFASAYDKAAEALAKYGEARTGVEQIIARRPDAANLTAKFQQLDAEIGDKAESTPSRREGKSSLEDISKQAAEIIQKAVEAVKSFFTPPGPENASRPGPSPI
ncbi:hypothetical protein ACELLULO517_22480 [Acidisoma cellulosilytica]|uniref:Uncharacterized protein n=1 Tax=Acidisoma cellulosilyticum TaxID=2802395 RepID=A0A963Z710_9PROT|nr:hypothetical protein [Acidisoma cellulosilyticum]MCB8883032.1 hypothetical protein [Acidisoma cellulosilyticum]